MSEGAVPTAPPRRGTLAAAAFLAFLVALALGGVPGARILFERDVMGIYWGMCASFARAVESGALPLWNPWAGFGGPMLANASAQIAYPPTWLNLLLRPEDYYSVYAASHLLLAALGLLALARAFSLSRLAAAVAAALWTASGPLLSYVSLWHHLAGAGWMPWVLLAAERCARRPAAGRVLAWAAVSAVQVLAGSLDVVLMTAALEAGLVLRHVRWSELASRENRRLAGALLAAALLAVGLAAVQWVPTAALVAASTRAELSEGTRALWSLRPVNLVQWLVPLFPQDLPLRSDVRQHLFEGREPFLGSHYLGLAALPLALAAFLGPRRRAALGLAAVLALSTALTLGRHGLLYPAVVAAFPALSLFRYPAKAALVAAFAFALICGLGCDAWRSRPRDARGWAGRVALPSLALAALALAVLAVAWQGAGEWLDHAGPTRLGAVAAPVLGAAALALGTGSLALARCSPALGASLAALLAVADLVQAHAGLNPTAPRDLFLPTPEVVEVLRRDRATRVYAFDYAIRPTGTPPRVLVEPPATAALPWAWRAALIAQHYPKSLQRWAIAGSFERDPFSLDLPQRRSLWLLLVASEVRPADQLRLFRLGAVSHVIARHREGLDALAPVATLETSHSGTVRVLRVPGTLPRVLATSGVRVAAGAAAYGVLLDPAFDPRREVVLPEGEERPADPAFRGEARIVRLRPDRLTVAARLDRAGHLVVVEGWDAGWRAFVGGVERPVLRANAAFRAVALPAGEHVVEMVYRPRPALLGAGVSAAAAAAFLLLAWRAARAPRRGREDGA